jgi:hypothetical protein
MKWEKQSMRMLLVSVLAALTANAFADPTCFEVEGVFTSYPADPVDACDAVFPWELAERPLPSTETSPTCFEVSSTSGTLPLIPGSTVEFTGLSRLTRVRVEGGLFGLRATTTPLTFDETVRADAGVGGFTSRARLDGEINLGDSTTYSGSIDTRDSGVISFDDAGVGTVGQLGVIEGGTEDFDGAYGIFWVAGPEVSLTGVMVDGASYQGSICVP